MQKLFCCALAATAVLASAGRVEARDLSLTIANGRVTLVAQDVTIRQILDEWARVGQTRIVNGEKLLGTPMSIELRDVPESKALETVLRSAAGYVVAPRADGTGGASVFDRILILPTSRPPAVTSAPPAPFNRVPQPQTMPVENNDDEPAPGAPPPQPMAPVAGQPFPGPPPAQPTQPGMQQPTNTLPRPGMLPPVPNTPGNPYQPQQPGVRPPGGGATNPGARPGGGGGGA